MGPHGGRESRASRSETTATVERKVAALMCHKSQMADPDAVARRVLAWSREQAEVAGLADGASAELFRVTHIP